MLRSVNNLFHVARQVLQIFSDTDGWPPWLVHQGSQGRGVTWPQWQVLLSGKCLCVAFTQQPCWVHRKLSGHSESVTCKSTQQRTGVPKLTVPSQLLVLWRIAVADAPILPSAVCFWRQGIRESNFDLRDPNLNQFPTRLFMIENFIAICETYDKELTF